MPTNQELAVQLEAAILAFNAAQREMIGKYTVGLDGLNGKVDTANSAAASALQAVQAVIALPTGAGLTTTERTKLNSVASGATANSSDAALVSRANHQGTQAANTIVDLPVALTKLSGIASGATVNAADSSLRDRATHSGVQEMATVAGLQTALAARVSVAGLRTINGASIVGEGDLKIEGIGATAGVAMRQQTLVYAAVTQWPAQLNTMTTLRLTGNTSLAMPTGLENGRYLLFVDRDATGGWTITFPAEFLWPAGAVPAGSTAANTRDAYEFVAINGVMSGVIAIKGLSTVGLLQVPAAPTSLSVMQVTSGSLVLGWVGNAASTNGYNILRDGVQVNAAPIMGSQFGDTGLAPAKAYSYQVVGLNGAGPSTPSAAFATSTIATALPAVPTGFAAGTPSATTMPLYWTVLPGLTYNIYRSGSKVNAGPLSVGEFTDTGLAPATQYSYTLRAVGAAGEGAATAALLKFTATPAAASGLPAPYAQRLVAYWEVYYPGPSITTLSDAFTGLCLFNSQPLADPINGTRDGLGDGSFRYQHLYQTPVADIQALQDRGVHVYMAIGGAKAGFNFQTAQQEANCVASIKAMNTLCGGKLNGIVWNCYEFWLRELSKSNPSLTANNPGAIARMSKQLVDFYGPNFQIMLAPTPNTFGANPFSPLDGQIATALKTAGVPAMHGIQMYEAPAFKDPVQMAQFTANWVNHVGVGSVAMGLSANYSEFNSPTLAECVAAYRLASAASPGLSVTCWTGQTEKLNGGTWATVMRKEMGLTVVPPATVSAVPDESAITAAFASGSGQNGGWLTAKPAYLKKNGTDLVTTPGDAVWTLVDRSANTNHAQRSGSNVGLYGVTGARGFADLDTMFSSSTGGGSADVNSAGFCGWFLINPTTDYPFIWSCATANGNGRRVSYESFAGQITFTVGTGGTNNVRLAVPNLAPINTVPNIPLLVRVRQDASSIYVKVGNQPEVSSACPACSPGSANYALNGGLFPSPGYSSGKYYHALWFLNPLTPTLRDAIDAFMVQQMP